jgi:hypothetical protein
MFVMITRMSLQKHPTHFEKERTSTIKSVESNCLTWKSHHQLRLSTSGVHTWAIVRTFHPDYWCDLHIKSLDFTPLAVAHFLSEMVYLQGYIYTYVQSFSLFEFLNWTFLLCLKWIFLVVNRAFLFVSLKILKIPPL